MQEWKFAVDSCGNCGISLAKKKPVDVTQVTTYTLAAPDDPVVYAARCPKCHRYNVVTEKGATSEPEPVAEPEPEPEPEP